MSINPALGVSPQPLTPNGYLRLGGNSYLFDQSMANAIRAGQQVGALSTSTHRGSNPGFDLAMANANAAFQQGSLSNFTPAQPGQPAQLGQPGQLGQQPIALPGQIAQPAQPAQIAQPATSAQPAQPDPAIGAPADTQNDGMIGGPSSKAGDQSISGHHGHHHHHHGVHGHHHHDWHDFGTQSGPQDPNGPKDTNAQPGPQGPVNAGNPGQTGLMVAGPYNFTDPAGWYNYGAMTPIGSAGFAGDGYGYFHPYVPGSGYGGGYFGNLSGIVGNIGNAANAGNAVNANNAGAGVNYNPIGGFLDQSAYGYDLANLVRAGVPL